MANGLVKHVEKHKCPNGAKRSGKWPAIRRAHLKLHPRCAVCEGSKKIEVHHKLPFHLHPDLELDPKNLITLCENMSDGINCHLLIGHSGSFKAFNPSVERDAKALNWKIKNRPISD